MSREWIETGTPSAPSVGTRGCVPSTTRGAQSPCLAAAFLVKAHIVEDPAEKKTLDVRLTDYRCIKRTFNSSSCVDKRILLLPLSSSSFSPTMGSQKEQAPNPFCGGSPSSIVCSTSFAGLPSS